MVWLYPMRAVPGDGNRPLRRHEDATPSRRRECAEAKTRVEKALSFSRAGHLAVAFNDDSFLSGGKDSESVSWYRIKIMNESMTNISKPVIGSTTVFAVTIFAGFFFGAESSHTRECTALLMHPDGDTSRRSYRAGGLLMMGERSRSTP